MRHLKAGRKFNRKPCHRQSMLRNLARSIVLHGTVKTTITKAKAVREILEPLVTLAKQDSVSNRRRAFAKIRDKEIVGTLFTVLGPRYQGRPGGYLRVLRHGWRKGDCAPMALVGFVPEQAS